MIPIGSLLKPEDFGIRISPGLKNIGKGLVGTPRRDIAL